MTVVLTNHVRAIPIHRIPILTTVIMVIVCTADPSRLHEGTVDVSFLFGKVQVRVHTCIHVVVLAYMCM